MPPSPLPTAGTGFASARHAAHRAWFALIAVGLVPGSALVRIVPGFSLVGTPPLLSDGAPNLWAIVQALPWIAGFPLAGLATAMAAGGAAWLAAYFSAYPPRGEKLLPAALLVALVLPGLLPQMRPSDFMLAVGLSIATSIKQRTAVIAALVTGGWLIAMFASAPLGAAPIVIATILIARPFLASPANDNGLPLNPVMPYPA